MAFLFLILACSASFKVQILALPKCLLCVLLQTPGQIPANFSPCSIGPWCRMMWYIP